MAIINKSTFEIYELDDRDNENDYFECDELIAPVISLLNKKGYATRNCCCGHAFDEIQLLRIRPLGEDKNLSPIELKEKYDYISVSEKGEDGVYEVLTKEPSSGIAYISFASYVKLPFLPEEADAEDNNRVIRYWIKPELDEDAVDMEGEIDTYDFYERRLAVMRKLYKWAESLPDYDDIITEEDRKEQEFQNILAPKILDEYSSRYFGETPDGKEDFLEFAQEELVFMESQLKSTEEVKYIGYEEYENLKAEEKEAFLRSKLDSYLLHTGQNE